MIEKGQTSESELEKLKLEKDYRFPNMLAVENPYDFNTTGLYVYFKTDKPSKVKETIRVPNSEIQDFERNLKSEEEYSQEHEYLLTGIVPGEKNEITLTLTEKSGKQKAVRFDYIAPEIKSTTYKGLIVQKGHSQEKPVDGLFMFSTKAEEGSGRYSLLVDDEGIIRGELKTNLLNLKFKDGYLYTTVGPKSDIAKINRLGKVEKIYAFDHYSVHHDFTLTDDSLYALVTNKETLKKENRVNDSVVKIDLEDGTVTEIVDFKNLVPELYEKATGVVSHTVLNQKGHRDNIHPNSIEYIDESILISSRETSTIMKIDISKDHPEIEYFLSEPSVWEDIGDYSQYVYRKDGDFKPHAGQHSAYIVRDEKLPETSYYLYLFDNNSAIMESRKTFLWDGFEQVMKVPFTINKDTRLPKGTYSYYYRYLVDEKAKTYQLAQKIELPFSFFQGNVMEKDGHIIYGTSFKGAFGEYDGEGNVVNSFMLKENSHPYRVCKFDFEDYWFSENEGRK